MTRLRGWAPKGERLVDKVPHGRWKTTTFLAALRNDRIDAPCLFDGPINGERFRAYVEQFLVPTLKPGDAVILDNLGSHKGKAVRKAIRDVGASLVFLPKYSPDLNPIEQVFAKFKTLLRKAEARSYEAVSDACGVVDDAARLRWPRFRRLPGLAQERRLSIRIKFRRGRVSIVSRPPPTSLWPEITLARAETGPISASGALGLPSH
jgi:putative transposase